MDKEQQLGEKLKMYQEMAKADKNIDVAALMMAEMQQHNAERNVVSGTAKRWAYTISLALPPFGLLFALRYWFSDKDDGRRVALMAVFLTLFSLALTAIFIKMFFDNSGLTVNQLEQTPGMLQGLY